MAASFNRHEYVVGVITMEVARKDSERFHRQVAQAIGAFENSLTSALGVRVALLTCEEPHLALTADAYAPSTSCRSV